MQLQIIPVTPFEQNCSLVVCERTRRAALVDPGGDTGRLIAALKAAAVTLERIVLTHGHLDHVGAAEELRRRFDVPIEGPHREDAFWLEALPQQAAMFGLAAVAPFTPDRWLEEGDQVSVGEERLEVLHCPGHTPGHVVLFHAASRLALVGDVIFRGSIGRTDFPRGDQHALLDCIESKLLPLGDDVQLAPGHGPTTTVGEERRDNPFLRR